MKKEDIIEKIRQGAKLYQMVSFIKPSGPLNLNKPVSRKNYTTYFFEDGTRVHHMTGNSLMKSGLVEKASSERTLGGTKYELKIKK
jgi:hypothetical protein